MGKLLSKLKIIPRTWVSIMLKLTQGAFRGFLQGAGSVLDISGRDPIDPSDFVGFDQSHIKSPDYKPVYEKICQDMSTAWHVVLENTSASLPDDKQKKR